MTAEMKCPTASIQCGLMTDCYSSEHRDREVDLLQGDPIFISLELSSSDPEPTSIIRRPVLNRLEAIDYPKHADLCARAFPTDGGAAFMAAFAGVVDREVERNTNVLDAEPVFTDPRALHRPRHDVESFWWVLLWALIRASPLPVRVDPRSHVALCRVSDAMLDWEGLGNDIARARYIINPPTRALHPALRRYGPLMRDMAMYVAMPWHLYDTTVGLPRTHAHSAFQRMLLSEICALMPSGGDELGVFLDTTKPRTAIRETCREAAARWLAMEAAQQGMLGSSPDALTSPPGRTAGRAIVVPSKRTLHECDSDALERLRSETSWTRPEQDEEDCHGPQ